MFSIDTKDSRFSQENASYGARASHPRRLDWAPSRIHIGGCSPVRELDDRTRMFKARVSSSASSSNFATLSMPFVSALYSGPILFYVWCFPFAAVLGVSIGQYSLSAKVWQAFGMPLYISRPRSPGLQSPWLDRASEMPGPTESNSLLFDSYSGCKRLYIRAVRLWHSLSWDACQLRSGQLVSIRKVSGLKKQYIDTRFYPIDLHAYSIRLWIFATRGSTGVQLVLNSIYLWWYFHRFSRSSRFIWHWELFLLLHLPLSIEPHLALYSFL